MIFIQKPGRWVEQDRIVEITHHEITSVVANYYGVSVFDLRSKNRHRKYVFPRYVTFWFIRRMTNAHLAEIGKIFGNRDHTRVLYGIRQIDDFMGVYSKVKDDIGKLENKINSLILN